MRQHLWPAQIVELLEGYRRMALGLDGEIEALTAKIENAAAQNLPPSLPALPYGFGGLSLEIVRREVCDWQRFKNRRQVGSFFGICCAESSSGPRRFQGSIYQGGQSTLPSRAHRTGLASVTLSARLLGR